MSFSVSVCLYVITPAVSLCLLRVNWNGSAAIRRLLYRCSILYMLDFFREFYYNDGISRETVYQILTVKMVG